MLGWTLPVWWWMRLEALMVKRMRAPKKNSAELKLPAKRSTRKKSQMTLRTKFRK